jgi:hypothetical protein
MWTSWTIFPPIIYIYISPSPVKKRKNVKISAYRHLLPTYFWVRFMMSLMCMIICCPRIAIVTCFPSVVIRGSLVHCIFCLLLYTCFLAKLKGNCVHVSALNEARPASAKGIPENLRLQYSYHNFPAVYLLQMNCILDSGENNASYICLLVVTVTSQAKFSFQ